LIASTGGDSARDIRDRAILMLFLRYLQQVRPRCARRVFTSALGFHPAHKGVRFSQRFWKCLRDILKTPEW